MAKWPDFSEEEIEAVGEVLRSGKVNYWTGAIGKNFEAQFAQWTGAKHAIALANGTLALDLALHGMGVGERNGGSAHDEVIVTPRTFIASVSCVINAGATPVFVDVERDSGNISARTIQTGVSERTKAVIPVHLGGWPVDLSPILELARDANFRIIEDCAQSHGALYKGQSVGTIGDMGAWSFCQDKIMTTGGEGGMLTCNDQETWLKMWSFKDHGKDWHKVFETSHPPGFRWLHDRIGTNWRLTEMQSAIGVIQLKRLQAWAETRNRNAQRFISVLQQFAKDNGPIRLPLLSEGAQVGENRPSRHAYYRLYFYVRPENLRSDWSRDKIIDELSASGVPAFQGSCSEVYLEAAFEGSGLRPTERLPVAKELGETSIALLVHPTLTDPELDFIAERIHETLSKAQL